MKTIHVVRAMCALSAGSMPALGFPEIELVMRTVPGGGAGPAYSFRITEYEITYQQFLMFINDAEANQGNARGANMRFDASGDIGLMNGFFNDGMLDLSDTCDDRNGGACPIIRYDRGRALGSRYSVVTGYGGHPLAGVSWIGAVKFCNWLTIDQGLDAGERCYTEGPNEGNWHPVVIDDIQWAARDLNNAEREALVLNYSGFRLPMDNLGLVNGPISRQENIFNEWYKAAAYDQAAPDTERRGPGSEYVSPDHWVYACGRDTIIYEDGNFRNSRDPYEPWLTPVGFFDGVNLMGDGRTRSHDTNNPYALYDLSGNVVEWLQDHCLTTSHRSVRGGSFRDGSGAMSAANRSVEAALITLPDVGFRVLQVGACVIKVRKTQAEVDQQQQDKVDVAVKLKQPDGPVPIGWFTTVKITNINNGRETEHLLKPSDERGICRDKIRLPSGTYFLKIVNIQDPNGVYCMPDPCRRCQAVFEIP